MWAKASSCSGTSLAVGEGSVSSLAPTVLSGAPPSSTAMWAHSVHTTQSAGLAIVVNAMTLAPVPFQTRKVSVAGPKRSRKRASASSVQASAP